MLSSGASTEVLWMLELILVSFPRYSAVSGISAVFTAAPPSLFISIYSYCYYNANDNN